MKNRILLYCALIALISITSCTTVVQRRPASVNTTTTEETSVQRQTPTSTTQTTRVVQ